MKTKEIGKQVDQVISHIESLEIKSEEEYKEAAEYLRDKVKPSIKLVKDHFEPDRKKTYEAYKFVTDQIKEYTGRLERVEKALKKQMSTWYSEQEKKRIAEERARAAEEAERRLQEAVDTGNEEVLEEPYIPEQKPGVEKLSGITYVDTYTFEIEDETKIPREYLMPDVQKIRKFVQAMKDDAKIDGVKVIKGKSPRVGS